jgi:ribosomal protein S18 acetylase RimI-like enzyme
VSSSSQQITGHDGRIYQVKQLSKQLASKFATELLQIHNIIPYVSWNSKDLLSSASKQGVAYRNKWRLSYMVTVGEEIAGLLVAYKREYSEMHPVEAIYIHRLAVAPSHQQNHVGSQLLETALRTYATEEPDVEYYTIQTNDEASNQNVIKFYETRGFARDVKVIYPDKVDILMKMSRKKVLHKLQATLIDTLHSEEVIA